MRRTGWVAVVVLAAACSEPDFWAFRSNTSPGPNQGLTVVAVWVSDSPVDAAESVFVAFDRVELGAETLSSQRRELDLLALRNGRRALLATREVPAGTYDRLRLRLAPSHRVVAGGVEHRLDAIEEVVDLAGPFHLRAGERLDLHVDVNARLSVVEAGGRWTLVPVASLLDPAGRPIAGIALPAGTTVSAQREGREVLSTRSEADGSFALGPLAEGTFTLVATAPGHAAEIVPGVRPGADLLLVLGSAPSQPLAGKGPVGVPGLAARLYLDGAFVALTGVDPLTGDYLFPSIPPAPYEIRLD